MTTAAATWVRFTRLIPLHIAPDIPAERCRRAVAALHARGWTADDIAHTAIVGINGTNKPALVIAKRLDDLITGDVPPPVGPDETPTPPRFDRASLLGRGVDDPTPYAERARAALAAAKTRSPSRSQVDEG